MLPTSQGIPKPSNVPVLVYSSGSESDPTKHCHDLNFGVKQTAVQGNKTFWYQAINILLSTYAKIDMLF